MKKHLAILSVMVLLLLVASQLIWIRRVFERDKSRFKEELNVSINKIVQYQATRQTYKLFEMNPESPSLTLESIHPDSVPNDAKSYGSYETVKYNENKSLAKFLEAAMTEMLLVKDTLNIHIIDSLFQNNFPYTSELLAYSFITKEKEKTIDSLYFGKNRDKQLNDTTKGVFITIPLGTSGTYRFVSHFVFKPSMATRNLMVLVWLSGIAVIAVALILFALLYHLQLQMNRLNSQEKWVMSCTPGLVPDFLAICKQRYIPKKKRQVQALRVFAKISILTDSIFTKKLV